MLRRAKPAAAAAEALADGAVATEAPVPALPPVLPPPPPLDPGDEEQLLPLVEALEDDNRRSAGSQLAF